MPLRAYLETLAKKHGFSLQSPGKVLQIEAVEPEYGPLVICVWRDAEERYAICRIIFSGKGSAAGFTVWLNSWGEVVRAVNDFQSNVGDLHLAEVEMP